MKLKSRLPFILCVVCLVAGCQKPETTGQKIEKVQEKASQAAQEMKDYTYAQKAEFVEKMQARLNAIHRELDQLAARVEKSGDAAKAEARPRIQALREQLARLDKQLDEVKNATESTWNEVKAGMKKSFDELKEGFDNARRWLSEKIAP